MKSTLGRWERDFSFVLFVCMFFFIICLYTFLYIFVYFSYCSSLYFSTNLILEKKITKKKKKEKKPNQMWKIQQKVLEGPVLCFSSYRNRQLKVKLRSVGTCERKKRTFLVPFILSEEHFLNICVLSQSTGHWVHIQNIHTFSYQRNITSYTSLLVF